jgi:HD-like signal output (HDOD) protein
MDKNQIISTILNRMREKGDFPSLSESVSELLGTLQDNEQTSIDLIVSHVVSDYALSQKVLKLANSAMYRSMGGAVTSFTRAIMVLGLDAVTYLALGLKLLDGFDTALGNNDDARKRLAQATLAANVTRLLSASAGASESEECVILSLFSSLGELALMLYMPEVWSQCQKHAGDDREALNRFLRQNYSTHTFDIAQTLARRWGFPDYICKNIRPFEMPPEGPKSALSHGQWSQALVSFSSALASAMTGPDAEQMMHKIMAQYAELLALDTADIETAVLQIAKSELLQEALEAAQEKTAKPIDIIEAALREADVLLRQKARPSEMLSLVLETTHRALGCRRTVFFVRDNAKRQYIARAVLGPGAHTWINHIGFDANFAPDAFHLSLSRDVPVKLDNISSTNSRVPAWYRAASPEAKACLALPVVLDGKATGLFLGEWDQESPAVGTKDIDRILSLRDRFIQTLDY